MSIFSIIKLCFFALLLLSAVYFGGEVTIDFAGHSVCVHAAVVVFGCLLIIYLYGAVVSLFHGLVSLVSGRSSSEKGIYNLQAAFFGLLLKDKSLTEKFVKKAKRHLGDIPLLSWIEGQLMLLRRDHHRAKSIFYALCEREKDTAFGAYGLCKIAIKDQSESEAINAIDAILKVSPNTSELVFQAIAIAL
jgi:hypothetical protein